MFRPLANSLSFRRRVPRRGTAILITVFALITILMVLGLAFMMYAAKEKAIAQAYKEGASNSSRLAPDPTDTINRFFGTLVYDEIDDYDPNNGGVSLLNSMRGHSIARSMYGSRHDFTTNPSGPWPGATTPWNGVGTFHANTAFGNRALQVNHTLMLIGNTRYLLDPEWTGNRTVTAAGVPAFATSTAARNYVGQHAGYTYPDLKNFFLGARDPATGEVLVSSFHRDWLFRHAGQPASESAFHPNNPNWGTATVRGNPEADARLRTLRPRPLEHPKFPHVAPDADGVYRGDVQNLPGTVGVQKNDSLWMDIGLPRVTLEDGRVVQPLVAPLILPLDGLFDMSIHGNRLAPGNTQASHGGYGPWEINPTYGMASAAESQSLMVNRTGRAASFDQFTSGRPLSGASVAWTGQQPVTFKLPTGGSLRGVPSSGNSSFVPPYGNFQNDNAALATHPAGYNPNDFAEGSERFPTSPVAPYSDLKRLSLRYAFTPDWYKQSFVAKLSPTAPTLTFVGNSAAYPYISGPGATAPGRYRLDPAHTERLLFSPKNSGLDRIAITPTFPTRTAANTLTLGGGPGGTTKPGPLFGAAATPAYPAPRAVGTITDFMSSSQWVHAHADLGSVNLNRPLADYRSDLTQPLSIANAGNAVQADADRQALAKDIFARLVVATGAAGQVGFNAATGLTINLPQPVPAVAPTSYVLTPTVGAPITFNQAEYDALRYLAQVAANLVDYIDNDDVSTVFIWNPNPATGTADLTNQVEVGSRVVFGVELPRLVINEAYGEVVNDPNDPINGPPDPANKNNPKPPAGPAVAKFWLELLNPTSTPPAGTALGDGSVNLSAYRIEIRRENRQTTVAAANRDAGAAVQQNYLHTTVANTNGAFEPTAGPPDAVFTFPVRNAPAVAPNNGAYAPAVAALPANGFLLVGPPAANRQDDFTPNGGVWQNKIESADPTASPGSAAMGYTFPLPGAGAANVVSHTTEFRRHIVLLRRLANPYLLAGPTNPYVTADMMDYVPAFDAIHRLTGQGTSRGTHPGNAQGYDLTTERFSVGKVQPYAGRSVAALRNTVGGYNRYNLNNAHAVPSVLRTSMVREQTTVNGANEPKHTFGRHNGNLGAPAGQTWTAGAPASLNDTLMTPFDWLPHMDRPLESLGDIFLARDCKPHLLTDEFAVPLPATAPGVNYLTSEPRWRYLNDGLARGLEYLTVKSPDAYVGHGGRVSGKVNVNAMQDRRVAQGVWDPQPSNAFNLNFVNNTVWGDATTNATSWMKSRTPLRTRLGADGTTQYHVPVPTSSVADQNAGPDRPFLSFGAPDAATGGTFAFEAGAGTEDTLLRRNAATPALPLLYQTAQTHPYLESEPARKVFNNVITVSHSFVVYVTIGYFEVSNPAVANWPANVPYPPQFGAEVYDKIPGDMRQKYVGVIDMSNMALKAQPVANDPDPHAQQQPFFTALTATARPSNPTISIAYTRYDPAGAGTLYVAADGFEMPIVGGAAGTGTQLVIGHGADTQVVTVTTVGPVAGQLTVSGLTRTAWGGASVSNVRPGYAGPQPAFDYNLPKYKPVVPYVERLR